MERPILGFSEPKLRRKNSISKRDRGIHTVVSPMSQFRHGEW